MAKSKEKLRARNLRKKGISIREISLKLKVSKSSVSTWCSDISLTQRQIENLHKSMIQGGYVGRLKGARMQKEQKQQKLNCYIEKGKHDIQELKLKELFIGGLALYWGEGNKKDCRVRFYNSDSKIIKFIMRWFREVLYVSDDRFILRVTVNKIHKERLDEIDQYWSKIANIPLNQFGKPVLIKAKSKKTYENYSQHYGTLCVAVRKSSELLYQILGWLKALGETA